MEPTLKRQSVYMQLFDARRRILSQYPSCYLGAGYDPYLKEVSSLRSPFPSSSEPCVLCPLLLLAAREEDAGDASLDVAGEDCFERALRETVLPLSKACLRKSCMALSTLKCGKVIFLD